jgi:hypothetical protein
LISEKAVFQSFIYSTFKSGANFLASSSQLKTREVGQTTRDFCFNFVLYIFCNKAKVCKVFQSPISSAKNQEKLYFSKKFNQLYQVC